MKLFPKTEEVGRIVGVAGFSWIVMPEPIPFEVSAEVAAWLSKIPLQPDKQPGFSCSPRYGRYRGEDLIEEYSGDHYVITHASRGAWQAVHAIQVVVGERPFWIPPDILDKLGGKTLSMVSINVSKHDEPQIRPFLVTQ